MSGDGNHVWGVTGNNVVYYCNGIDGKYTKICVEMKQLSVSYDGSHLWAIDKDDETYYCSRDNWMKISGWDVPKGTNFVSFICFFFYSLSLVGL